MENKMKSLSQIRALFVGARNLAKEASPAKAEQAAEMLRGISDHCKELYSRATSYMERAKCRNMYESIDNVIKILTSYGFYNSTVMAFFGLLDSKITPSFADISRGKGNIKALPEEPIKARANPISSVGDHNEKPSEKGKRLVPPPPKTADQTPTKPVAPNNETNDEVGFPPSAKPAPADINAVDDQTGSDSEIIYPDTNPLAPGCLDDFIGQEHVIKQLKAEIAAAKKLGKNHLDHILLLGNRGLGKSTIMKLVAKELGVGFEFIDCTSLMNDVKSQRLFQEFFINISKANRPVVIALDEIHALPIKLQSSLLTLLNDRVYSYLTESGTKNISIPDFTFIGATTDYDAILSTLKDRCGYLTFELKDYSRDELRRIFKGKLGAMELKAEGAVIDACINRCRSSIRELEAIVKGLKTRAITLDTDIITLEMAERYFADRGMDKIGLKDTDRRILQAIADEAKGFLSEETLAARVYLDPKLLTKEYEPFLMKIGFISVTSRGRYLTPRAEDYLKYGYYDFGDGVTVGELPAQRGDLYIEPITEAPAQPDPDIVYAMPLEELLAQPDVVDDEPIPELPVQPDVVNIEPIPEAPAQVDECQTPANDSTNND